MKRPVPMHLRATMGSIAVMGSTSIIARCSLPIKALMLLVGLSFSTTAIFSQTLVTNSIAAGNYCPGDELSVPYTLSGVTTPFSRSLRVQHNNADGTFPANTTANLLGLAVTVTANQSGSINVTIPTTEGARSNYRVRVVSTNGSPDGTADTGGNENNLTILARQINPPTYPNPLGPFCWGDPVPAITFSTQCTFDNGNVFNLELSDRTGSFSATGFPKVIGTLASVGGTNLSISGTIPNNDQDLLTGNGYRLRIRATANGGSVLSSQSLPFRIASGTLETMKLANAVYCQGDFLNLTYKFATGEPINAGNVYQLQLSNAAGDFTNPTILGFVRGTARTGSITGIIPYNQPDGAGYKIRIFATNGPLEGCEYGPYRIPGIRPLTGPVDQLKCLGENAIFTVASGLGGVTYQWQKQVGRSGTLPFNLLTKEKNSLGSNTINDLYVSGSTIIAATSSGVSFSSNTGTSFVTDNKVGNNLVSDQVNAIAVGDGRVFAGTDNGLSITTDTDGGGTWSTILTGLPANNIQTLFQTGTSLYVGTFSGLARYVRSGANYVHDRNWTTADGLVSDVITDIFIDGNNWYIATFAGLSISNDGGLNFTNITTTNPVMGLAANSVRSVFAKNGVIYAGTDSGLSISTNGGLSWTTVVSGLADSRISEIFVDNSGRIYVGNPAEVAVKNVGASAFTSYTSGLGIGAVSGIVLDNNKLFVGVASGIAVADYTLPMDIGGAMSSTYNLNNISPDDALARYQAVVSIEINGTVCRAVSNMAALADIPPLLTASNLAERDPSTCGGVDGKITVSGLLPSTMYIVDFDYTGIYDATRVSPQPEDTVTTDQNGVFSFDFLAAGTYSNITVASLKAENCTSPNPGLEVILVDPPKPAPPAGTVDPVCAGTPFIINLSTTLGDDEEYAWFLRRDGTISSNPSVTQINTYSREDSIIIKSGSIWVSRRNRVTGCESDTIKIDYTIIPNPTIELDATVNNTVDGGDAGEIVIKGLEDNTQYLLTYTGPDAGNPAPNTLAMSDGDGKITITNLKRGSYDNITVTTDNAAACVSNPLNSVIILDPADNNPAVDPIGDKALNSIKQRRGGNGGYFQFSSNTLSCAGNSIHVNEVDRGIAVGRMRQFQAAPNGNNTVNDKAEMRGWLQFNLSGLVPPNAFIEKVEYRPRSMEGNFVNICEVPVRSATGDIQFDVTQVNRSNYGPYTLGYNQAAFDDIFNEKYNDFTIGQNAVGPWVDLGAQGIADLQEAVVKYNGIFQLGLALSGTDFDVPVYQFHGIVFNRSEDHELRITYHLRDFGDLKEPKYATDLAGGLVGPSHRVDSIDINSDPAITTLAPALYIGATPPDYESNGLPSNLANRDDNVNTTSNIVDDEDLGPANFTNPVTNNQLISGEAIKLTIPGRNNLPRTANLVVFIDWNADGVFQNATERYSTTVEANSNFSKEFDLTVPLTAKSDSIGVRVRLTSGAIFDAYGPAPDGEVEDFMVEFQAADFGDLPDPAAGIGINNFRTRRQDNGARHGVAAVPNLFLGAAVDEEADASISADADGDDKNDPNLDDEDGIVFVTQNLIPGEEAIIRFSATNRTAGDARLFLYADFNNDGSNSLLPVTFTFGDPVVEAGEVVANRELRFLIPQNANFGGDRAYFRFRLAPFPEGVDMNAAPGPDGVSSNGEVEDYIGTVLVYDWADLPEPLYTTDAQGSIPGPSHRIRAIDLDGAGAGTTYGISMFIGATPPDAEVQGFQSALANGDDNDNSPDDEDLGQANFTNAATGDRLIAGNTIRLTFPVTNRLSTPAKLVVFLDWNGDGDFEDTGERLDRDVPGNTIGVNQIFDINIPVTNNASQVGVRVRMSNTSIVNASGPADHGEVEDFFVTVFGYDYGDLPDVASTTTTNAVNDYFTLYNINGLQGPRHLVDQNLKIGNTIDAEGDGQPQANAFGDDINTIDDEDGVIQPDSVVRGKLARFQVFVTNKTDQPAYLVGFVDWNNDGSFEDGSPNQKVGPITIPARQSGYYNVDFLVPTDPNPLPERVAARFRLSNENSLVLNSRGPNEDNDIFGEVEDLWVSIVGYDWGDHLEYPGIFTDRQGGTPGPSHRITAGIHIGATSPDAELEGQISLLSQGDDVNGDPDEDLNQTDHFTSIYTNPVDATLPDLLIPGQLAKLEFPVYNSINDVSKPGYNKRARVDIFIDWNRDGDFQDDQERFLPQFVNPIPNNTPQEQIVSVDFIVPQSAVTNRLIPVRVRISTETTLDANGQARDGEVEDFLIVVTGQDFGDLPDLTASTAKGDYQTLFANNGARHVVILDGPLAVRGTPRIYMGAGVDTDVDGRQSAKADGDDTEDDGTDGLPEDDEDGIIFLTPLAPGQNAQVSFRGVNNTDDLARLHIYADWNNDGILEAVVTSDVAANTTVANNNPRIINFTVPANATLEGGGVFFRFRFTSDAAFNANPSPNGQALEGEVEDYFVPVFKLGNLVWEDRNHNGLQDLEEINLGIQNVRVVMRFGGINPVTGAFDGINPVTNENPNTTTTNASGDDVADYILQDFTDSKGIYGFTGMIEGNYQIISIDTFGLTPTRTDWIKNVTEEDLDSDGKALKNPWEYVLGERRQAKSQVFVLRTNEIATDEEGILDQGNPQLLDPNALEGFPDNRVEQRIDFGYVGFDFGDLAETGDNPSTNNFITQENGVGPEGPKHIVIPDLRLGVCQDVEWEGQPDPDAGAQFAPNPPNPLDGGGDDPNAEFSGYPNSEYDPSQGRRWPFHNAANVCGDDEDGIRFLTPLVAGYEAIISVRYSAKLNLDGPDAYLHAWIDWNGDGDFTNGNGIDENEHIIFIKRDGVLVPNMLEPNTQAVKLEMSYLTSASDSLTLSFRVPKNVAYNKGNILSRFRISYDPRIGPNGILAGDLNFPDGIVPYGEVEDYFMKLSKIGNLVFEDRDYDGFQDDLEPGIANVPIEVQFAGADGILNNGDPYEFTYRDTTDKDGRWYVCGLIGNQDPSGIRTPVYRIVVKDPPGMTSTFNNPDPSDDDCDDDNSNGDDLLIDNRITADTLTILNPMALCQDENERNDVGGLRLVGTFLPPSQDALNNFPDNQYDETRDFGYTAFDYGDLPQNAQKKGSFYLTLRDSMDGKFSNKFGARHAIQPRLYLGTGVDAELNGNPDDDAGSKTGGDDDHIGLFKKGTGTNDDENGVRLLSPLLPGEFAYIKVKYTSQDTTVGSYVNRTAYLDAFIDWDGDGKFTLPTEKVIWTHQAKSNTATFSTNRVLDTTDTYTALLPATGTTGVDSTILAFYVPKDAVFDTGAVMMRFRLGWTDYKTAFGDSFEYGLGPDNNIFHSQKPPYVKAYEPFFDNPGDVGRYPYPQGEVEDYAIPVAKIGNLAWYDHDVFGDQDAGEDVVDSLHLVLIWGGVDGVTGAFDTVGYFKNLLSGGNVTDIVYNLTIAPPQVGNYTPGVNESVNTTVKTGTSPAADSGLYSFRGLIPGIYYVLPRKYMMTDSASFVDFWPKHRVLTLQDNINVPDTQDSDGLTSGLPGSSVRPGAMVRIRDGNNRQPEVCVNDRPLNENGKRDADDNGAPFTKGIFPDNQSDKSVDFGWVDEPNIEANLDIVGVNFPTSLTCGNFNVITHLCVKNPTEVPLDSLQMFFDLKAAYGNALFTGTKPIITIVDSSFVTDPRDVKVKKSFLGSQGKLVVNPNYDGVNDLRLLVPTSEDPSFLLRGDSVLCVRIEFEIDPTKTDKYPWMLQANVTARAVGFYNNQSGTPVKRPLTDFRLFSPRCGKTLVVSDASDEFDDPMPMTGVDYPEAGDGILFEGRVADRGLKGDYQSFEPFVEFKRTGRDKYADENDKTIHNDECWIKTKWNDGQHNLVVALDEKCEAIINADLMVPNFDSLCGFDKYPEGSYYRVIIQDKHTEQTLWASVDRVPFEANKYLDRHLIYKVRSVANHCFPVWGDIIIEDKIAPVVTCPADTDRKINGGVHTFVCTDIDSVLNVSKSYLNPNYAYFTGIATATDACGTPRLDNVADKVVYFTDCVDQERNGGIYAQITRVFTFVDLAGNKATCTQKINFRRPRIILPACKIEVPNNLAKGDSLLLPKDLVGKYKLADAVPYFINGAGNRFYATGTDYCGFAFAYKDQSQFITGQGACGKKLIREWSILDWCYTTKQGYPVYLTFPSDRSCYDGSSWVGGRFTWKQTIIVGDDTPPQIFALDVDNDKKIGRGYGGAPQADPTKDTDTYDAGDILTFSTGPMDCTGAFLFTRNSFTVVEQSDWCFTIQVQERKAILDLDERPTGRFVMTPSNEIKVTGDCNKGFTVTGVPMKGDWFVEVTVSDACYTQNKALIPIRIVDKIAPVMVCDDQLNITLDNVGRGFVAAKDLDEGSWDNCGKLKWVKVRRPVSEACMPSFLTMFRVIDVNKDGKIGAKDNREDYIDLNRNGRPDADEYFTISEATKLLMTPLMDTVPFFCCDGSAIMTELWGEDKVGNRNYCWKNIQLDDKTPVVCMPPLPQTVDCLSKGLAIIDDKKASALAFGDIIIMSGNTCAKIDTAYTTVKNLRCGYGTIERVWTLTKQTPKGAVTTVCKQVITVTPVHEYNICFPKDTDHRKCGTPVVDTAVIDELGCDILAVNISDKRYAASDDECYKIFRTFTVINWCVYDDRCGDQKDEGRVYIVDRRWSDHGANSICVLVRDENRDGTEEFYLSRNTTPKQGNLSDNTVGNDNDELFTPPFCQANNEFYHSFMYTQIIKVYDEERPVVKVPVLQPYCAAATAPCRGTVAIPFKVTDNCTDVIELEGQAIKIAPFQTQVESECVAPTVFDRNWTGARAGTSKDSFLITIANLPEGKHDLIVVVRDECGNLSVPTRIPFEVKDCKAPAPICINGLATELMPNGSGGGAMTVWASDFVASPIYDCNGQGTGTVTGPGQGPSTDANGLKLITKYTVMRDTAKLPTQFDEKDRSITVTCADAGKQILVRIHAWDEKGNNDYCVTFLEVQDNRKVCGSGTGSSNVGVIDGTVQTEGKGTVQGVKVELSGQMKNTTTTPADGKYAFRNLETGYDYSVTPSLDVNPLNGVSTFDLVLMQKHILGIELLNSPYKLIAADINNSKSITTLDLILLRKLILNLDTKFTANTSWRFVDATYRFPESSNPWSAAIPEIISINNLNTTAKADFVAVKVGDVNGNASTTAAVAPEVRKVGLLELHTVEQELKAGVEISVPVRAKDLANIEGYQFTLELDRNLVELVDVDYGVAKADNFGIFRREGLITTSWNRGTVTDPEAVLFTLQLRGRAAGRLSESLRISSRLTANEGYNLAGDYLNVALKFGAATPILLQPELLQNVPNPFSEATQIGFYLPEAAEARLTIRDVKGAIVYRTKAQYGRGWNQVTIKQSELNAAGVFYYSLETANFTATKKMVLLNK